MAKKPLAEVMAGIYINAHVRYGSWAGMHSAGQSETMGAMTEVVRSLNLLGVFVDTDEDGIVLVKDAPGEGQVRLAVPAPAPTSQPPPASTQSARTMRPPPAVAQVTPLPAVAESQSMGARIAEAAFKGFSGEECTACGSLKTVRIGSCIRCSECLAAGECG